MGQRFSNQLTLGRILTWMVAIATFIIVAVGFGNVIRADTNHTTRWASFLITGIVQGSIYALIALGYTMVYGILGFINFAHGEVFMTGAMMSYFVARYMDQSGFWDANPILAVIIAIMTAMVTSTAVAIILERAAYRPLRSAPRLQPLITSLGASFFIQYAVSSLFGPSSKSYPRIPLFRETLNLGIKISVGDTLVIVAAVLMMVALYLFVEKTKTGRSIRAVAEDKEIAALMGIDVDRVIIISFAVGGMMAGAAGVLYALSFGQISFSSGVFPGIKAFTAAVLGGIGNIPGAMLGGIVLGLVESFGSVLMGGLGVSSPHQLKDMVAFLVLILVLIFRPSGLLGERLSEEKA